MAAVEAREGLHRLNAGEAAVYIHAAEQGLIETGLKFVGH